MSFDLLSNIQIHQIKRSCRLLKIASLWTSQSLDFQTVSPQSPRSIDRIT